MDHKNLKFNHAPHKQEYVNAEQRLAAVGFTSHDLYKQAVDLNTYKYWVLTNNNPIIQNEIFPRPSTNEMLMANPIKWVSTRGFISTYCDVISAPLATQWTQRCATCGVGNYTVFGLRSPMPAYSGKWYLEAQLTSGPGGGIMIGTMDGVPNDDSYSTYLYKEATGTIFSLIVDTDIGKVDFYRNGSELVITDPDLIKKVFTPGRDSYFVTTEAGTIGTNNQKGFFHENTFNYPALFAASGAKAYYKVPLIETPYI